MAEWIYNEVTHDWEERPSEAPAALDYVSVEKASVVLPMTQEEVDDAHSFGNLLKDYLDEAVRGKPRVQAPPSKEDVLAKLQRDMDAADSRFSEAIEDMEAAREVSEAAAHDYQNALAALRAFEEEHGDS